jgi:hypothetical protein
VNTHLTDDGAIARLRAQSDNARAVESMLDYLTLPAPTVVARHDVVYVTVADADDLLPWLHELGGVVRASAEFEGLRLWTLSTFTPPVGGARVPVRVSVPVPVGEPVMADLVHAVVAA